MSTAPAGTTAMKASDFKNGDLPDAQGARDIPFAALFCVQFLVVCVLAAAGLSSMGSIADEAGAFSGVACSPGGSYYVPTPSPSSFSPTPAPASSDDSGIDSDVFGKIGGVIAIEIVVGALCAAAWLWLAQRYPKELIIGSIGVMTFVSVAFAVATFAMGSAVTGVFMLVMALFTLLLMYLWRKRIPFASALLSTCATVTKKWPAMLWVPYYGIFAMFLWLIVWGIHTVVWFINLSNQGRIQECNGEEDSQPYTLFYIWAMFAYYWTAQVLVTVVHVTISGVFATWYFLGGDNNSIPKNPTSKALKRACTTSFGSVCLGSLVVAALQTLKGIIRSLRSRSNVILYCIIICLLNCIERLIQYFNKYAFVQVAVYGKSYCEAAKATYELVKSHGVYAVVNDMILGGVLALAGIIGGIVAGGIGFLVTYLMFGADEDALLVAGLMGFVGLLLGYAVMMNAMRVIDSGVATIFVCFACDPEALRRNDPELHNLFISTFEEKAGEEET